MPDHAAPALRARISSYEPPSEEAATRAADWNALSNTYGFVRSKARGLATKG